MERAVILCDGYFGQNTGKTANGLVRYSKRYEIVGVIDHTKAGRDAGEVLDGKANGIPIVASLKEATVRLAPHTLIVGVATFGGYIPQEYRPILRGAIEGGLSIVAGLHEYLSEDPEFATLAEAHGVRLVDVRKPKPIRESKQFSDLSRKLPCLRIPVLGTDGAIGKRTTALLLTDALNEKGISATFVATGQTGLMQGSAYGVPLDSIKGDFMVGELESEIVRAYEETKPKVVIVEGQGSISHPAYACGTRAISNAAMPSGMLMMHAPARPAPSRPGGTHRPRSWRGLRLPVRRADDRSRARGRTGGSRMALAREAAGRLGQRQRRGAVRTGGRPTCEVDPCAHRGEPVPSLGSSRPANPTAARAGGSPERLRGEAQCPGSGPRIEAGSVASRGCVRRGRRARPP